MFNKKNLPVADFSGKTDFVRFVRVTPYSGGATLASIRILDRVGNGLTGQ